MNYNKIKQIAKAKRISIQELTKSIDSAESTFYAWKKNDNIPVNKLEAIAAKLEVSPCIFFDDYNTQSLNNCTFLLQNIKVLEDSNSYLLEIIKGKSEIIDLLKTIKKD